MSKGRKFRKQRAKGRRPLGINFARATNGLPIASGETLERLSPSYAMLAIGESEEADKARIERLEAHLPDNSNDLEAVARYAELTGRAWSTDETQSPPAVTETPTAVARRPELLGIGGGQWGSYEVFIAGEAEQAAISEGEWNVVLRAAVLGAYGLDEV